MVRLHLKKLVNWSNRDEDWKNSNSLFQRRFLCRRRPRILRFLLSLVSIWSSGSSRSSQLSQKMFRRSGRSYGNATQTTANDPDDWDDLNRLDRVEFYPDDRDDHVNFEAIIWKRSRRLRRSGRSKAIAEVITFIPVIENKFGPDGAEAEKNNTQMFATRKGFFEIRESPWHQVFEERLCLRGTLLASQCRKINRKSRYQGTRFALRIKIIHLCGLLAKHAQKFYCLNQRHRWRPHASCLWGDRDDHIETTNRPSRPDRLEIFWNDWGDRDDPDDHMETRL